MSGYPSRMARRIREEYIEDEPVVTRRRVVTERRVGPGPIGFGPNPIALLLVVVLLVALLVFLLGVR